MWFWQLWGLGEGQIAPPPQRFDFLYFLWRLLSRFNKFRFAPPPPVVSCFGKWKNCFRCWKISICTPPPGREQFLERKSPPPKNTSRSAPGYSSIVQILTIGVQREVGNRDVRLVTAWALMRNRRHAATTLTSHGRGVWPLRSILYRNKKLGKFLDFENGMIFKLAQLKD